MKNAVYEAGKTIRNIKGVDVVDVQAVDPVSLISHDKVLVTVGALKKLEEAQGMQ